MLAQRWFQFVLFVASTLSAWSQPAAENPVVVGRWPGFSRDLAASVVLADNHAYLANSNALLVFDVRSPQDTRLVAAYKPAVPEAIVRRVAVLDHYAYTAALKGGLLVLDISDPTHPQAVGWYSNGEVVTGVALTGSLAVLSTDQPGFLTVDISDKTHPQVLGRYVTPSGGTAVAVSGSVAFVAEGQAGVEAIDFSIPSIPRHVGQYDTEGQANAVHVSGGLVYVADGTKGLQILDFSDRSRPRKVGEFWRPYDTQDVAVEGHYAYVAMGTGGLHVLDITNPAIPILIQTKGLHQQVAGVAVSGQYVFLADKTLEVLDVSDPANPQVAWSVPTGFAKALAMVGNFVYIADQKSGVQVLDISDLGHPEFVGQAITSANAEDIVISGNRAYVADSTRGISVLDISDPAHPAVTATGIGDGANGIAVSGNYVFAAAASVGLQVFSPCCPDSLVMVAQSRGVSGGDFTRISVSADYAYLTGPGSILGVFDIHMPCKPSVVGQYRPPASSLTSHPNQLSVIGNYAFVLYYSALEVIDVSQPANPHRVSLYPITGWAAGLAIRDSRAYIVSDRLRVLDISDPANPRLVGATAEPISGEAALVSDNRVYIAAGYDGLVAVGLPDRWFWFEPMPRIDTLGCHLFLHGPAGRTAQLQRSTDLNKWENWRTIIMTGQSFEVLDDPPSANGRFYRALLGGL